MKIGTLGRQNRELLRERVLNFPLFRGAEYRAMHADLQQVEPLQHYVHHGLWERRPFIRSQKIAGALASIADDPAPDADILAPLRLGAVIKRAHELDVGIYVSSQGNFFMSEIAEMVALGLRRSGVKATLLSENASIEGRPRHCIYFAPHEFFELGRGPRWATEDVLSTGFMFSTEQAQTPWFRTALPYLLCARGTIDLNYQTYRLFRESGIPALFYFPGYPAEGVAEAPLPDHPLARSLPRAARSYDTSSDVWAERPLDLVFLGAESPIREEFLARNAAYLASLSTFIYYVRLGGFRTGPLVPTAQDPRPALNRYICRRAKIVLNLHQGEVGYFEWHRMVMQGMWHRALVVSDRCLPHPVFKAGVHYLEETPRRIPKLIDWLLTTSEGRLAAEKVRNEATAVLVEQASMRRMSLRLAAFLLDQAL